MEKDMKPRKRWVALAMGLTMPGMGQVYNGEWLKGLSVFIIFIMTYLAGMRLIVSLPDTMLMTGAIMTTLIVLGIYLGAIVDAYRTAVNPKGSSQHKSFDRWYIYLAVWMVESVLIMGGVTAYVKTNIIEAYKIVTVSMEPVVLQGDRLFVDKTAYSRIPPMVGDIVVFIYPDDRSKVFIKQIEGLPGDLVTLADGSQTRVPHGSVYVLGKGETSIDSRTFGFIPLRDLLGKARQVYWSSEPGRVRWKRIGTTL